jgi:hypothetical protein
MIILILNLFFCFQNVFAEYDIIQDRNDLLAVHRELSNAVNTVNVEKAISLIDNRVVFVNIPGTVTIGHEGIRRYFDIMLLAKNAYLRSASFDFEVDGEPVIIDQKFAIAHGHSVNHYQFAAGGTLDLPVNWSASMIKNDGKWKVVSLHVAGNVFNNPLMAKAYWIMIILGIISLIIVAFVFYRLGLKKAK